MSKRSLLFIKVLEIALVLLIFFTPVSRALSNTIITLMFFLLILKIMIYKDYSPLKADFNIHILVCFLISLLSILKANNIELSIRIIISPLFKYIVFYFLAYDLIKKEKIRRYCNVVFFSGILVFSYGFYIDYFTVENFFNHNNSNGTFAAFMTIFFLTYLFYKKNNFYKKILLIIGSLAGFVMATSYSRGASLAFAVAIIVWLVLYFLKERNIKSILIILTVIILFSYFVIPDELIGRFKNIENIEEHSSLRVRLVMWKASLLMIRDNPLLGVGIGNFNSNFLYYIDNVLKAEIPESERSQSHPHNLYLYIASEQGIISLIVFLLMIIGSYRIAYLNYLIPSSGDIRYILGLSLIGILTVLIIHSLVDTTIRYNQVGFYTILFIVLNLKLYKKDI